MHYYKRNLGDYAKKAGRLTMLQHGSYTLLIDACYDREQFPTMEQAIEWCWAATPEEICAVQFVLSRFFVLQDGVYVQERIQEEITEYREKATKNQRIAQDREAKRKEPSTTRARNVNEAPPNHKPITINQEPNTPLSEQSPDAPAKPKKWGTEEDHKAARWIFSMICKLNRDAKEPNWDGWANDIRLMRESDRRTHHQICELFKWANADDFWKSNILSTGKLREKWDQLAVKLNVAGSVEPVKIPRREVVL